MQSTVPRVKMYVIVGEDHWAAEAELARVLELEGAQAGELERVDCEGDEGAGLLEAVATADFFGRRQIRIGSLASISVENLAALEAAGSGSDALAVARVPSLTPSQRTGLAKVATVFSAALPRGKDMAERLQREARAKGVRLDPAGLSALAERCADDLARASTVLTQLKLVGLTSPTSAQVIVLIGTASAGAVPWAVSDALEAGRTGEALALADRLEPLALTGFLLSRLTQLGRVLAMGPTRSSQAVMDELALSHAFQADKLRAVARRLDATSLARGLTCLQRAEEALKGGRGGRSRLDLSLYELAGILSR